MGFDEKRTGGGDRGPGRRVPVLVIHQQTTQGCPHEGARGEADKLSPSPRFETPWATSGTLGRVCQNRATLWPSLYIFRTWAYELGFLKLK
ncbi:unnamed protein product, partial [Mesorhabditis spiculigera]